MGGSEEGGNAIFERLKMQDLKTHDAPNVRPASSGPSSQ